MPIPTLIDRDARCAQCQYNLRGLTLDDSCPECGRPVLRSVRYRVGTSAEARQRRAAALEGVAELNGHSLDAMEFVLDLVALAASEAIRQRGPGEGARHVTAQDLCALLVDYAKYHFGGEEDALLALEALGPTSSDQLGQVLFALVDARLLQATPEDKQSHFDQLFTLDTLYAKDSRG